MIRFNILKREDLSQTCFPLACFSNYRVDEVIFVPFLTGLTQGHDVLGNLDKNQKYYEHCFFFFLVSSESAVYCFGIAFCIIL